MQPQFGDNSSTFENPYNVTSFKKKRKSNATNSKDSKNFGKFSKDAVQPLEKLPLKSPEIVTVKQLDKGDYRAKGSKAGNQIRLQ